MAGLKPIILNRLCMVNRRQLSRQAYEMAEKHRREVKRVFGVADERYLAAMEREEIARQWNLLEDGD